MTEYLTVFRVRVAESDVERLLDVHPAAIAEAQRLCPDLLRAELVRLDDGTWLHLLRWSRADGEERLMRHADRFDAVHKMHELLADPQDGTDGGRVGHGEIVADDG